MGGCIAPKPVAQPPCVPAAVAVSPLATAATPTVPPPAPVPRLSVVHELSEEQEASRMLRTRMLAQRSRVPAFVSRAMSLAAAEPYVAIGSRLMG